MIPRIEPNTKKAYSLLHYGALALAEVEANGICVDVDYLRQAVKDMETRITEAQGRMRDSEVGKKWQNHFGEKTNFDSGDQLGHVLFNMMQFPTEAYTTTGKYRTDVETLGAVDHPFVTDYLAVKKLQKAKTTYLVGILREVVDGKVHPFFNLHTVRTYRSSSDSPNFQNIPVRDAEMGKLIRKAFIARPGNRLVEIDYSGAEVRVAACYHKDPAMLEYILDPTKDMHRDMAAECFLLPVEEVTKKLRYSGKNEFVFPQFYGDYYVNNAKAMWGTVVAGGQKTVSGKLVSDHLAEKGITELGELSFGSPPEPGTFAEHIQSVERHFWNVRFPKYSEWKMRVLRQYQQTGTVALKTGFVCKGFMRKNEVINYPVQGAAFHCLLWSLTKIVLHEIPRRKLKAKVVGQIHDSLVCDVPDGEMPEFLGMVREVMTEKIQRAMPWLVVPLEIEAEASPVDGCWADKKTVEL